MKTIGVVTATRAEYGVLRNFIKCIQNDAELNLCLFVTGAHLSEEQGMTISEIEKDGFPIAEKVDILMQSDSPAGISRTMGMATILFSDIFLHYNLDMLVLVGDRYELLAIASSAINFQIPIAHISGGETTEGAIDESIRHCLTKMSYLHFPACEDYRKRIIQLGEHPDRVFNYGDVGVENIQKTNFLSKEELEKSIGINLDLPYICVTFHPVTHELQELETQVNELLQAVVQFEQKIGFIFTKANADVGGRKINNILQNFVESHSNCQMLDSLGSQRYLSLLKYSEGIMGNSSSGIIEAPILKIPTINIGNRQKGRLQATSIVNCLPEKDEICNAIEYILSEEVKHKMKEVVSPYEGDNTSEKIVEKIKECINGKIELEKQFYDLNEKE